MREPKPKTLWHERHTLYEEGSRLARIKVMAVADGWVMCRRAGCIPFVVAVSAWADKYVPANRAASQSDGGR